MIIVEHLNPRAVSMDLKGKTKKETLQELTEVLINCGEVESEEKDNIVNVLLEREKIGSTGIGHGVAIPHGKYEALKGTTLAAGYSKKGVDFDSADGEPVHFFFLLLTSPKEGQVHLKILARLSRFLKDRVFVGKLSKAKDIEEFYEIIKNKEEKSRIQ
jgi:PTS system nitrogen regulatory IIA component